jgi:hypothetical protein
MRKKKQENLNNKKSILKELLSKIIFNKVVLIDNQVFRGIDLERGIYKEQLSNNFINIDLLIYNDKKEFIYSDCLINIVNNNSIKKSFKVSKFNKKSFNFISELNRNEINKIIEILEPIVEILEFKKSQICF